MWKSDHLREPSFKFDVTIGLSSLESVTTVNDDNWFSAAFRFSKFSCESTSIFRSSFDAGLSS